MSIKSLGSGTKKVGETQGRDFAYRLTASVTSKISLANLSPFNDKVSDRHCCCDSTINLVLMLFD